MVLPSKCEELIGEVVQPHDGVLADRALFVHVALPVIVVLLTIAHPRDL
jgi:hypothetical protein